MILMIYKLLDDAENYAKNEAKRRRKKIESENSILFEELFKEEEPKPVPPTPFPDIELELYNKPTPF